MDKNEPSPRTYRDAIRVSLKRMRGIMDARDQCGPFIERLERVKTGNIEGRESCINELKTLTADFDKALRVELGLAEALVEMDFAQASSAVAVVAVMNEKAQERLARLKGDVRRLVLG